MKNTYFWVVIALLLGFSLFGIFKSIELSARNMALGNSLSRLEKELILTQKSLDSTRKVLGESYLKNAELEGRLIVMDKKVASQARDIKANLAKISALSAKLQETARANAFLSGRNQELAHELLVNKLESDEMKKKLSSVEELKKAINELKSKVRQAVKNEQVVQKTEFKSKPKQEYVKKAIQEPVENLADGNQGFLIKEGQSTYSGWVDISVETYGPVVVTE